MANTPAQTIQLAVPYFSQRDSTSAAAEVQALSCLGIRAQFRTNGDSKALIQQLTKGIPCPVGWDPNTQ